MHCMKISRPNTHINPTCSDCPPRHNLYSDFRSTNVLQLTLIESQTGLSLYGHQEHNQQPPSIDGINYSYRSWVDTDCSLSRTRPGITNSRVWTIFSHPLFTHRIHDALTPNTNHLAGNDGRIGQIGQYNIVSLNGTIYLRQPQNIK